MEKLTADPNGATSASEYKFEYVKLHTQTSEIPLDITKMINYVEVFESIYSPFLTLNINISDTQSIINTLPLIGEEFLEIDIRGADGKTGIVGQTFYIHSLTDKLQAADKTFVYTLHCISAPAIFDMNLKISQAIQGQPSEIVMNKLLKNALTVDKPVYSHPTKHSVAYISNYWSPVQNIKYLCDRSVSEDTGSASYIFFETVYGFNFVPLDILVARESLGTFFFGVNTHASDMETQQHIIQSMYVDESFNYIDRIMSGMYGNRALTVDVLSKNYNYSHYDFTDSFNKFNRLNESPFGTDNVTRRINSVFKHRVVPSSSYPSMVDEYNMDWFKQRVTELASINSQQIHIDISGKLSITAGSVIDVFVPKTSVPSMDNNKPDMLSLADRSLSGRYLITGLKHMFDRERYTTHLELSKDSMLPLKP